MADANRTEQENHRAPNITLDGIPMWVPDSITTEKILERGNITDRASVYRVNPDNTHETFQRGQQVHINPGDRLGTVSAFEVGGYEL